MMRVKIFYSEGKETTQKLTVRGSEDSKSIRHIEN